MLDIKKGSILFRFHERTNAKIFKLVFDINSNHYNKVSASSIILLNTYFSELTAFKNIKDIEAHIPDIVALCDRPALRLEGVFKGHNTHNQPLSEVHITPEHFDNFCLLHDVLRQSKDEYPRSLFSDQEIQRLRRIQSALFPSPDSLPSANDIPFKTL